MRPEVLRNFINLTTARTTHAATYNFAYNILIMKDSIALHMSTPETHIPHLPPPLPIALPLKPLNIVSLDTICTLSQLLYIVSKRSEL